MFEFRLFGRAISKKKYSNGVFLNEYIESLQRFYDEGYVGAYMGMIRQTRDEVEAFVLTRIESLRRAGHEVEIDFGWMVGEIYRMNQEEYRPEKKLEKMLGKKKASYSFDRLPDAPATPKNKVATDRDDELRELAEMAAKLSGSAKR